MIDVVQRRPVAAVQVLDKIALAAQHDPRMVATDRIVRDHDIAVRIPPQNTLVFNGERRPGARTARLNKVGHGDPKPETVDVPVATFKLRFLYPADK